MNFIPSGLFGNLLSFQWLRRGNDRYPFSQTVLEGSTRFNRASTDLQKLAMVLQSPAALKVFTLQCDLFSMAKVCVLDKEGKELDSDPFLDLLRNPNPFQSQSQFMWDFMFWTMLGIARCYVDSKLVDRKGNKLYFLTPYKIQWPDELTRNADKLVFADATVAELSKKPIIYRYADGTTFSFTLDKLISSTDLTNGLGNWFGGPNRIDALYKIISNSEHALDSKNINVRYAGKFLVGSQSDVGKTPMSDDEKKDIEEKVDSLDKRVWGIRSQVNIRRFVENLAQQQLGDAYLEDYFLTGNMYGIPRDVLEAYNSATYENQEKARGAHVSYCLAPKGEQFMDSFEKHFGYTDKNITLSWDHLPFMQVFEKQKADVKKQTVDTFSAMRKQGIPLDEVNEYLGTDFTEETKNSNSNGQSQPNQAAGGGENQNQAGNQ